MIEFPSLVFELSRQNAKVWTISAENKMVGTLIFSPTSRLIPADLIRQIGTIHCHACLMETDSDHSPNTSNGLWLAGLFSLGGMKAIDVVGNTLGGWQGEWMRILGHPAGRVVNTSPNQWKWLNPAGYTLANWQKGENTRTEINFIDLKPEQAYCRIVGLFKSVETLLQ